MFSDVPSSKSDKFGNLGNNILKGQMYLEVPVQKGTIPKSVLNHATDNNIIIRNINGKQYNEL